MGLWEGTLLFSNRKEQRALEASSKGGVSGVVGEVWERASKKSCLSKIRSLDELRIVCSLGSWLRRCQGVAVFRTELINPLVSVVFLVPFPRVSFKDSRRTI